jgi:hypothetical protein
MVMEEETTTYDTRLKLEEVGYFFHQNKTRLMNDTLNFKSI